MSYSVGSFGPREPQGYIEVAKERVIDTKNVVVNVTIATTAGLVALGFGALLKTCPPITGGEINGRPCSIGLKHTGIFFVMMLFASIVAICKCSSAQHSFKAVYHGRAYMRRIGEPVVD